MDHIKLIEEYKKNLFNAINNSNLTIALAYYVLKDVCNDLYLALLESDNSIQEQEFCETIETQELKEEKLNDTGAISTAE